MSCIKHENILPFVKYEIPTTTDFQKHVNYILVHSENFKQLIMPHLELIDLKYVNSLLSPFFALTFATEIGKTWKCRVLKEHLQI